MCMARLSIISIVRSRGRIRVRMISRIIITIISIRINSIIVMFSRRVIGIGCTCITIIIIISMIRIISRIR